MMHIYKISPRTAITVVLSNGCCGVQAEEMVIGQSMPGESDTNSRYGETIVY